MALQNSTTYGNGLTAVQTEYDAETNSATVMYFGGKTTNSLKYPLNLFSRSESVSPAFIKFNILEVIPDESLSGAIKSTGNVLVTGPAALVSGDFKKAKQIGENWVDDIVKAGKSLATARLRTMETGNTIALYMPPAIQINDSMVYESVDTKGVAEIVAMATKSGQSFTDFMESFLQNGAADIVSRHLLSNHAKSGGMGSGIAANALISSGKVANPSTKLLFRSPSLRQFQLDFRMLPTSQKEANEIRNIVSMFRQAAYPVLDLNAGNALYNIPNLFNIKFGFKRNDGNVNPYMIHFKRCYLSQITTTYNGSGVSAFFKDGSPIETNLTLTFQETETNSAFDILGTGNYTEYGATEYGAGDRQEAIY